MWLPDRHASHMRGDVEMPYLDIAPILAAIREQPSTFSISNGWLKHRPSRHRFKVQADGHVTVDAECGCAGLSVRTEQGRELHEALQTWQAEYWIPNEINRHFARHFQPASFWRRWLHKTAMFLSQDRSDGAFALYGRTWAESGQVVPGTNNEPPPARPARPDRPLPIGPSANVRQEPEKVTA
jgi:hypothetical protein